MKALEMEKSYDQVCDQMHLPKLKLSQAGFMMTDKSGTRPLF